MRKEEKEVLLKAEERSSIKDYRSKQKNFFCRKLLFISQNLCETHIGNRKQVEQHL